jgi:TolB-like protein/Flp pilus assembly protein TadD
MDETRKIAAILVADVVGYSRLAGADEDRILARLRTLRSDLIDPTIAVHRGRVVKRTGDGSLIEFRSVVDAVNCAIEVQNAMLERNAGVPRDRRIEFRIGIHLGDVVEESDGDLMGDGVNIAARLQGICEPRGIYLSEDAYRQVRDKVKEDFADLGLKELKNIARPMRVFALGKAAGAPTPEPQPARRASGAPHLSIVVLPFANLGGNREQDYFVDGVTESLTTDLSRINGSFVIASNTALTFKGKACDVRRIGRELNVRYVLEGSVQRGGDRMRVNAQLIDAETAGHLWAERFDKTLVDLLDMQDEIVSRLADRLGTELVAAEARRGERAPDPDSMDLYFQGLARYNSGRTREIMIEARGYYEQALALDPRNLDALAGTAAVDVALAAGYMTDDRAASLATAEAALAKALSLAPNHPTAIALKGVVQVISNRAVDGIATCERALVLNPNLAFARAAIGQAKIYVGRAEEAEAHVNEALKLSPQDSFAWSWMMRAAGAKLHLGADEEAVAWLRRSIGMNRSTPATHFHLAAALANLDRVDEAKTEVRTGLVLDPTFTIRRFRDSAESDNPVFLKRRERIYSGMGKAGVPEG